MATVSDLIMNFVLKRFFLSRCFLLKSDWPDGPYPFFFFFFFSFCSPPSLFFLRWLDTREYPVKKHGLWSFSQCTVGAEGVGRGERWRVFLGGAPRFSITKHQKRKREKKPGRDLSRVLCRIGWDGRIG